jgi:CRISPR-associated protein (TIGR02584 family)
MTKDDDAMSVGLHVIALLGLSPAVVTETLWALRQKGEVIGAVTLITTATGADMAKARLTGETGAICAVCAPSRSPRVRIATVTGAEGPLNDLRTSADHHTMQALINKVVYAATHNDRRPIHASLAGGRKTMSAALSLAMSLYARPIDTMSHVLVEEPWGSDPNFLFPRSGDVDAANAVTLVELPFLRLRDLGQPLVAAHGEPASLQQGLSLAQAKIDTLNRYARLDFSTRTLTMISQSANAVAPISIAPIHIALLSLLAKARDDGLTPDRIDRVGLGHYYQMAGATLAQANALSRRLADPITATVWLREHISRLRTQLSGIDPQLPQRGIAAKGRRPSTRYCLTFRLDLIGD